jgi:cephalosporin hydroxylase
MSDAASMNSELEQMARLSGAPVEDRLSGSLKSYWVDRFARHAGDSYAGVPLLKFPEDLRVYEHLLWESRADTVIEIGTHFGGSALWFRDRLRTLAAYGRIADYHVITIDRDDQARDHLERADPSWAAHISLLCDDVRDPAVPESVAGLLTEHARCFVVEDSAHVYDTTMAALTGFARFVPPDGFFVVEDGCVDVKAMRVDLMRLGSKGIGPFRRRRWPHGVLPAVSDWLAANPTFVVRRDLELYGMTCHPSGVLQRRTQTSPLLDPN